jgi:hypothetical protein
MKSLYDKKIVRPIDKMYTVLPYLNDQASSSEATRLGLESHNESDISVYMTPRAR